MSDENNQVNTFLGSSNLKIKIQRLLWIVWDVKLLNCLNSTLSI